MLPNTYSSNPSAIFITMNKAGSVIANEILARTLASSGLVHVNFATEAFNLGTRVQPYCAARAHLFRQPGYYFGAFRETTSDWFGDLSKNKIIIQIRDPRDCLVSLYFSYKHSHPEPGIGDVTPLFNSIRIEAQKATIDEYVLTKVEEYKKRFAIINILSERFPNHLILKYEDMVLNFRKWHDSILKFMDISFSQTSYNAILDLANFKVETENFNNHKRQVSPGDFKRKLTTKTQLELTTFFHEILERFNYSH